MKNQIKNCLIVSFVLLFYSCFELDIKSDIPTFEKITNVPKLIPYKTAGFGENKFPGIIDDYKVFFGSTEVPISKITQDSIFIFVPLEVQVGRAEFRLIYKESEFNLGEVEILDWNTVSQHNMSYFETNDERYPYQITDSISNSVIPQISNGRLDKIHIISHEGNGSLIELNPSGLPAFYYSDVETVIFDGYDLEKFTVNIARFPNGSINEVVYKYGIPLDSINIQKIIQINGNSVNGRIAGSAGELFSLIGLVMETTGCIAGSALAVLVPPATLLAGVPLALTCASAGYSWIKLFNPDTDNEAASSIQAVQGIKMSLINCLSLIAKPKNAEQLYDGIYGCYGLALATAQGADVIFEEFRNNAQGDIEKVQAILSSGYGDIKITLDWDSATDIDLWVIDPNGERIFYGNPNSASEGELDLDNVTGFGPENVFWPINRAPFGRYKVQIHYYEPGDGPVTSYRVTIYNFGKSKTFTGTITYDQVITIAEFEANQDWGTGDRLIFPNTVSADRGSLPNKN